MTNQEFQESTGGLAFPFHGAEADRYPTDPGMTLRDYLAGQALVGLLAHPCSYGARRNEDSPEGFATRAYIFADAMLAARKPKQEGAAS